MFWGKNRNMTYFSNLKDELNVCSQYILWKRVHYLTLMAAVLVGIFLLMRCTKDAAKNEIVVLRWMTDPNPLRKQQVALFEEMFPGVKIELDVSGGRLEKVLTQIASGAGPDLTDLANTGALYTLAKIGALYDITDLVKEYKLDLNKYWPQAQPWYEVDGRIYGLPNGCISFVMLCNLNLFRKYGVELPNEDWTWDDFREIAVNLTHKDDKGRYECFGYAGYAFHCWWHWLWQNGTDVFSPDLKRCILDSQEAKETVRFIYNLRNKWQVAPSPLELTGMSGGGGWGQDDINLFAVNKIAMLERGRDVMIQFRKFPNLEWTAVSLPRKKFKASDFYSRTTAITRDCKHPREAFKFMRFLYSEEFQRQVVDIADGQPSRQDICGSDYFLRDPNHPEDWERNMTFYKQTEHSRNIQMSPYIPFPEMERVITTAFDEMWSDLITPEEACDKIAKEINAIINKNISSVK